MRNFVRYWNKDELNTATVNDVRDFLLTLYNQGKASATINLHRNAIKFFFKNVLLSPLLGNIPCAKRPQKFPTVLSREEIRLIMEKISNKKHWLLVSLAYGAGLRVSEVVKLKVGDLYFDHGLLHIRESKGYKDRMTIIPQKLIMHLQKFIALRSVDDYLFESARGGRLTTRSAQKIFENALQLSAIPKNPTFHSLRHSFATHLIENGVDIRYIQELLGHQNIRTTQLYTRVTALNLQRIKSPL